MNAPTIIVLSLVALALAAIIVKGVRDKKHGKGSCSCGSDCGSCSCGCHEK